MAPRNLVFASSAAVYGDLTLNPTNEEAGPLLPISMYGAAKLACEGLIAASTTGQPSACGCAIVGSAAACWGQAGALRNALPLPEERFLVMYGDSYLPIDYAQVYERFAVGQRLGLMVVYENGGRYDWSNVRVEDDLVVASIFAEQLEPWLRPGDVLVGLSVHGGSGSAAAGPWSQNLLRALSLARERGAKTIGLAGFGGGAMGEMADVCLVVPRDSDPLGTPAGRIVPRGAAPPAVSGAQAAHRGGAGGPSMMEERKIRVLIAKPGLDGHDRGAKVVARALRDAGMEVIYTGIRQTPQMIAEAALQEDVDVVGLSILSGAHLTLFPRVAELLRQQGQGDVLLFGGGIIPDEDVPVLERAGVRKVFGPGTTTTEIIEYVRQNARAPYEG